MTTITDYCERVRQYAATLDASANDDWEAALLTGGPRPLTARAVGEIADWVETESPATWDIPVTEARRVADGLRSIVMEAQ